MKKSKRLCRTKATAILKFFCFKDGTFAFFYEVRKNGLVKYYVNCNKKQYGPYEEVDKCHDQDYPVCSDKSSKDFIWTVNNCMEMFLMPRFFMTARAVLLLHALMKNLF